MQERTTLLFHCKKELHLINCKKELHLFHCKKELHLFQCKKELHLINCKEELHLINCKQELHLFHCKEEVHLINCKRRQLGTWSASRRRNRCSCASSCRLWSSSICMRASSLPLCWHANNFASAIISASRLPGLSPSTPPLHPIVRCIARVLVQLSLL